MLQEKNATNKPVIVHVTEKLHCTIELKGHSTDLTRSVQFTHHGEYYSSHPVKKKTLVMLSGLA